MKRPGTGLVGIMGLHTCTQGTVNVRYLNRIFEFAEGCNVKTCHSLDVSCGPCKLRWLRIPTMTLPATLHTSVRIWLLLLTHVEARVSNGRPHTFFVTMSRNRYPVGVDPGNLTARSASSHRQIVGIASVPRCLLDAIAIVGRMRRNKPVWSWGTRKTTKKPTSALFVSGYITIWVIRQRAKVPKEERLFISDSPSSLFRVGCSLGPATNQTLFTFVSNTYMKHDAIILEACHIGTGPVNRVRRECSAVRLASKQPVSLPCKARRYSGLPRQ
ncbi:hypothetical protein LZ30DRAFT_170745 [Colletotrichum cereale]|nr:hypothetical protein LZ30DRAFT_170745 [Colletotrichum cereale]